MSPVHPSVKSSFSVTILLFVLAFMATFQSCKKRSEMGNELFKKTKNKVFKDLEPDSLAPVLHTLLDQQQAKLNNAAAINAYYKANGYDAALFMEHFSNDDIRVLLGYYNRAGEHGLSPAIFQVKKIDSLLAKISDPKRIKTADEAYHDIAQMEIWLANSLITYSNSLQYGILNPKKLYSRYFTDTKRPDSTFMTHTLGVGSFKSYLDSIQPKDPQYLALQKALAGNYTAPGLDQEATSRILKVNLERLRWKNKPSEKRYVLVNIPDFQLNLMNEGKVELNMKVCVGEGRNKDYSSTIMQYPDSDNTDKPFSHETPQLNSKIEEAQVNPVWNIPVSIAKKETIVEAQKDPYYLSNKNINVYKNGKLIEDSEDIVWNDKSAEEYSFKQQPGADNSLGKIKFLFPNKSSVYLHDTPAKRPFGYSMRAVSHGCVRLERPLDFAKALFGEESEAYKLIAKDMAEDKTAPTDLGLPKKVPVYITYVTCWADDAGQIQIRPDVYALDIVAWAHLQKLM